MTTDSNGRGLDLKTPRDGEERGPTEQAEPAATERLRGKVKTVVEARGTASSRRATATTLFTRWTPRSRTSRRPSSTSRSSSRRAATARGQAPEGDRRQGRRGGLV